MNNPMRTNITCVNQNGMECEALVTVHKGCHDGTCPFYKTEYDFKVSEAKSRRLCEDRGIGFVSREKIIHDIKHSTYKQNKYKKRKASKAPQTVVQYNTDQDVYIEYNSLESASQSLGIDPVKLELIIKKNEVYGGYRFVYL